MTDPVNAEDDLVERLQNDEVVQNARSGPDPLCQEAADRIAALEAVRSTRDGEIERLLASSWFYGRFKAETHNERLLQQHMERTGWWPIESEADLFAKIDDLKAPNVG